MNILLLSFWIVKLQSIQYLIQIPPFCSFSASIFLFTLCFHFSFYYKTNEWMSFCCKQNTKVILIEFLVWLQEPKAKLNFVLSSKLTPIPHFIIFMNFTRINITNFLHFFIPSFHKHNRRIYHPYSVER